jgi:hypothetical protein
MVCLGFVEGWFRVSLGLVSGLVRVDGWCRLCLGFIEGWIGVCLGFVKYLWLV